MKPTLLLLAAGMGSRYGGLKQLDGLGPNGETIMDYSIYDAIKAGFGKIVFVIEKILKRISERKSCLSMRGTFLPRFVSSRLTVFLRAFPFPRGVRSRGAPITP